MSLKQVSLRQLEMLIDFMTRHKDLALGRVRSKEGRALSSKLWRDLAGVLNSQTIDGHRTAKEWNKFYNDYKCRVKNKARRISQSLRKTGGGPVDIPTLTPLEERLCEIIGPDQFRDLPVCQNPLQDYSEPGDVIQITPSQPTSEMESDSVSMQLFQVEAVVSTHNVEEQSTPISVSGHASDIASNSEDIEQQSAPLLSKQSQDIKQPSTSRGSTGSKRKKPSLSINQLRGDNEIEKTRNILANIEKAKVELNQAQLKAQLERNEIENKKVEAMNSLANAAWALVNIFKHDSCK